MNYTIHTVHQGKAQLIAMYATNNWRRLHGFPLRRGPVNKKHKKRKCYVEEAYWLWDNVDPQAIVTSAMKTLRRGSNGAPAECDGSSQFAYGLSGDLIVIRPNDGSAINVLNEMPENYPIVPEEERRQKAQQILNAIGQL